MNSLSLKQGPNGVFEVVTEPIVEPLAGVGEHQPDPVKRDDQPAIQDLVIADIQARKLVGLERYGTLLKANNGRDALMDLYQELLDAVNYIRQVIEERDAKPLGQAAPLAGYDGALDAERPRSESVADFTID